MVIRTDRFVVSQTEVRAISRTDSKYHKHVKVGKEYVEGPDELHSYSLEIHLFEGDTVYLEYGEDKAARDTDYELVASVLS